MRVLTLALLILCSTYSAFAADQEANKRLFRDYLETVFNKRQVDAADRYLAENLIEHNPNLPQGLEGRK
jgi:predicted SnoaL-like aldol condensation-catalyzing enzyme